MVINVILKSIKASKLKMKAKQKSVLRKNKQEKFQAEILYSPEDQMGLECQDCPVHQ